MTRIKTALKVTAICLTAWGSYAITRPAYQGSTGITYGTAYAPVRQTDVDFHIWYPAQSGGRQVTVGGNGVFYGTAAGRNAPHDGGRHPMIVISHGSGGNAGQFGWIASALADAGYVVVLPNHPGTTTGNASAEAAVRVWERPKDVSAVIDHIINNPDDYPYIDTSRIGMLGFSAGGYTAMAIAGARVNPDLLQRFCDDTDHGMSDCAFLGHNDIDLHAIDLSPAAQDLTDPRVRTAVIIDPGIIETVTPDSLSQIKIPMMLVNLGDNGTVPAGVNAVDVAKLIPQATFSRINTANHFSFLAQCKPRGSEILRKEKELDLLCEDVSGRARSDIHAELIQRISTYLQAQL